MKRSSSRRLAERVARFMPGGIPRYVRCYDMGDAEGFDRYTVVYSGRAATCRAPGYPRQYQFVGLSGHGFTNWHAADVNKAGFAPAMGRKCHLGRRIPFMELPEHFRRTVLGDYAEIWGLTTSKEN